MKKTTASVRAARSDGQETKRALLAAAGPLFAQKGYARATAKEICQQAGADLAAVNYHYGGKDGLYQAVLVEAHAQLVTIEELQAIAAQKGSAKARLENVLRLFMSRMQAGGRGWGLQVLMHEIFAPSDQAPPAVRKAVLPKARIVMGLIAGVLGLPPGHPAVQRATALVVMPCVMLLVVPAQVRRIVLPAISKDPQAMVDDLYAYVFAGLAAIRAAHAA
ncbi:MAG: CerR family C-terminal domain-containing protein [Proteobacteria bacterium]|nr:CerR family C-terminal domain-containing protein [Pseudomonadota bacterium]